MKKEWEITQVVTVIRKVEVKADSYEKAEEIYDEQLHDLDWWVDEEYVDDYEIEEIE
tara:strand:- start:4 stop:174 length:171 start_codon:yes stop_codon:yes gene_type:complete